MSEPKKKTGRPKIEYDLAVIRALGAAGVSNQFMADYLGVSRRSISREMKKNPERKGTFAHAYAQGAAGQNIKLLQHTFERAFKSDKVLMFVLERKFGWLKPVDEGGQEVTIRHVDATGKQVNGLPTHLIPFPDRKNVPPKQREA